MKISLPIRSLLVFFAFSVGSVSATPALDVLVVDDDGGSGVDFTSIQPAIDAAVDGDTILIKAGTYTGTPHIDGKGLVLMGEVGTKPVIEMGTELFGIDDRVIENIPATSQVTLRGLEFHFPDPLVGNPSVLYLKNNTGTIWIEDCVIGEPNTTSTFPNPALWIEACDSVIVLSTQIVALDGDVQSVFNSIDCYLGTQVGLSASNSGVFIFDSTIEGGDGPRCALIFTGATVAADGSDGLIVTNSSLVHLEDTTVIGGEFGGCLTDAGGGLIATDGGDAVDVRGLSSLTSRLEMFIGGGAFGFSCSGDDGEDLNLASSSTYIDYGDEALTLQVSSPAREGEIVALDFQGPPAAPLWIAVGTRPLGFFVPTFEGAILVAPPWAIIPIGTLDANGTLSLGFTASVLPPGVEATMLFAQSIYLDASTGKFILGSASALIGLSAVF